MAGKGRVEYAVVDAFTESPFGGNPAAVVLWLGGADADAWMQSVAKEFNLSETAFVSPEDAPSSSGEPGRRFRLRWFTPVAEIEVASENMLQNLQPQLNVLKNFPGRGIIVTAAASPSSDVDFISRFFCPRLGIDEDPVTGSAHCALAPYWSKKLGKHDFTAYQASPRGGKLILQLKEDLGRVLIQGEAISIMAGSIRV
ncbi:uncharacterized protein LOC116267426 isoform X2 [Nymphaea colorata]|uniref:uncharacterized protein LOC116267426 isoform X2 n=1 Tax=Nymphaea colorata TaxID=210225 RepID=UPI00129EF51F|nr:uncharacterized protein LOC116267426 isoform X2 [Nymphaea colorata]